MPAVRIVAGPQGPAENRTHAVVAQNIIFSHENRTGLDQRLKALTPPYALKHLKYDLGRWWVALQVHSTE
jgi:hypothetical protein